MTTFAAAAAFVALSLAQATPEPLDASAFRDKLMLLTDGQGHYFAIDPERPYGEHAFVGDGKTFARLPVHGGGKNGDEAWNLVAWDPRVRRPDTGPASIEMKDYGKQFQVRCAKRVTELKKVPGEEAKKLLASAVFTPPTWTRQPEKLLRDETGVYYLVDRFRTNDTSDRRDFRVFVGPRGNMKQVPLKDIVDDVQGLILSTKTGNLRLITSADGKLEGKWIQGKKVTPLLEVPLDNFDTGRLIYLDLGPYAGQRLGTPCDDFM